MGDDTPKNLLVTLARAVRAMRASQRRWGAQRSWLGGKEVAGMIEQELAVDNLVAEILVNDDGHEEG